MGFNAFILHSCREYVESLVAELKQSLHPPCCSSGPYKITLVRCSFFCMWIYMKMANSLPFLQHLLFWTCVWEVAITEPLPELCCWHVLLRLPLLAKSHPSLHLFLLSSWLWFSPGSQSRHILVWQHTFPSREALVSRWRGYWRQWLVRVPWNCSSLGWDLRRVQLGAWLHFEVSGMFFHSWLCCQMGASAQL